MKIAAGKSQSTLEVPTRDVAVGEKGCVVTATIAAGAGYQIGAAAGASASATLAMQPVVTITADSASVTEGSPVSFTLTASPPPVSDLVVNVSWSEESGSFLPATTPRAATISASAPTAPLRVTTVDDDTDAQDGSVTVTVEAGSGYTVGSSGAATVTVTDNDTTSPGGGLTPTPPPSSSLPQIQIRNHTTSSVEEGEKHELQLVAFPEPESKLTVNLTWTDASRVENPPSTFMIPKPRAHEQSIHTLAVQTIENNVDDGDIRVYVEVADGSGYEPHPEPIFSSTSFVIKEDDD
ncbi:MAG: hypothetical protein OXJ62_02315 [Spirochaetaceae bacterium]|nr:hypothetical protein [Spirochaetaceae bacterium]